MMKLFVVTSLKEYLGDISKIFNQANIRVFSTVDIIGYKQGTPNNLLDDWFASGEEDVDSMMIFSFTSEEGADHGMELIIGYNKRIKGNFPVRAFVLPVEKSV
ncbi:hypothetical protein GO495_23305 [Chitinophaga oryziterrae]|uniref:Uncharacterized protein n=1 Tax=Chitinophaga oryziterrae TaxID=1031224 RepID=A0A6N8JEZ7_9BACT|nr:hypothetical protein [Chitinophaga oryziterrae]MVT43544.1 hypothetical protein [Chitinophaga oryziterrae]